jgi:tripartite-type tricarboxylate transporter receptor subunit TctC
MRLTPQGCICVFAAAIAASAPVLAADYPTKAVRFIVPFPAGAGADTTVRAIGRKLSDYWGKPVVVDNRPGIPGMQYAAQANPDGYTLVLGSGASMVTAPLTISTLPYGPKDFTPVSGAVQNPPILVANPAIAVKSIKELIAVAKAKPGALNYNSSGTGGPNHLAMELFTSMTGTRMVHVPYKGGAPAVIDLIAGHVQLGFHVIMTVMPHMKSGKLVPLGVGSTQRASAIPDIPAIAETVPGFEYTIWYAIFAPARTPSAIVNKVSSDVQRALKEPDIAQPFGTQGMEPHPTSPQGLASYVREDTARWSKIVKERNLKVE